MPCSPSPCGKHNVCDPYTNQVAICGGCSAPENPNSISCKPECLSDSDCSLDKACIGWRCADPCLGSCGVNADCEVIHHSPVCSCPMGLFGNPYQSCAPTPMGLYFADNFFNTIE